MEAHMDETREIHQRLFFALWPSDEERRALARWRDGLPVRRGRATRPGDLHLTLAFAGDVDGPTRACMEREAEHVRGEPFSFSLDRVGQFRRGLLWTGPTDCPAALIELAGRLAEVLRDCGVTPDPKPFHPHVTLFRRADGVRAPLDPPRLPWQVDQFCLVHSRPGEGYAVVKTYALCGDVPPSLSEPSASME
jgi:RNA 2',3'-cyclic 3'-phosphodiesterase